jgi:hypothetical protein
MLALNPRIHALAAKALALANNNIPLAIKVLIATSGLAPEQAFEALDHVLRHRDEAAE